MPEHQTTAPSESAFPVAASVGVLHAENTEQSPTSPSANTTVAEVSMESGQNTYAPQFIDDVHDYIREHIRNADRKAVFFFGSTTAVLAFLHSVEASTRWLKPVHAWNLMDAVTFLGMLGIALAALSAAWTVVPRLPGSKRGLLYFIAIAERASPAHYATEVLSTSQQVLINEKAMHCHVLASVCRTKYKWLRASLWLSF